MSSASAPPAAPTEAELARECATLPVGWVVGWSKSNGRRFWARPPGPLGPELKLWERPAGPPRPQPSAPTAATPAPQHRATPPVPILVAAPVLVAPPPVVQEAQLWMPRSPRSPCSLPPPLFVQWTPPTATAVKEEADALEEATASLAEAAAASAARAEAVAIERERARDEASAAAAEAQNKKRRAGLGFDTPDEVDADGHPSQRQKLSHGFGGANAGPMRFVTTGGVEANTPASSMATVVDERFAEFQLPKDPRRLESASAPRCTVADPHVYTTSTVALAALSAAGASTPISTEWSDATKYHDILRSSVVIAVNSIYAVRDPEKEAERMDEYLKADQPLPPPPQRDLAEEPPTLITARRSAFNELDLSLTQLVRAAGLRDQPTMAFLRWGFNQRSLQNPTLQAVDPLLPMDASIDACLAAELVREKMPKEAARDVCRQLSERCKEKATQLLEMKTRLVDADPEDDLEAVVGHFDLLLPEESHLHSFAKTGPLAGPESGMQAQRDRDLHTFNQSEREQYKIIYDRGGPMEYAIPLNHARFTQLCADYTRTTGPIAEDVKSDQVFLRRLWAMCARYDTISGAGYQAALPEESFAVLKKYWAVEHECYASPLNHYLDSFGSAFIETDRFFGSRGSFLDQRPIEGGFEANPPFLEEVMAPMAMHVLALLERAQKADSPLCIVAIWPGWDDTPAYDLLMTSRFMRKLIVFERNDHSYKEGLQHRVTKAVYRQSRARSFVFWMQTDAAAVKWPCAEDRLTEFKRSFMARRY